MLARIDRCGHALRACGSTAGRVFIAVRMKLRFTLTLISLIGGLAFAVASASAHCGSCDSDDKTEHACPADCQKECCKDKKKTEHPADCACDTCKSKSAHPADC